MPFGMGNLPQSKEELAGAVALVASKDKVLAVEAVGFADRVAKLPMKADEKHERFKATVPSAPSP